jgi:competence protein ComFC
MSLFGRLRHVLSQTQAAGSRSITLVAPSWNGCVVCGNAVDSKTAASAQTGSRSFAALTMPTFKQNLCAACYSAIPWLERIKCPICGRGIWCEDCQRRPARHFVCNRSAVSYDATMRSWLALYKYRGYERLAPVLAEMLVPPLMRMSQEIHRTEPTPNKDKSFWRRLIEGLHQETRISACWDAITYVPISAQRAEERGFNQAREMASHLSNRFGIPLFDLLARDHHSEKMSFKSRAERIRDARSLFSVNEGELRDLEESIRIHATPPSDCSRALRILLVDDIYTTGSTVEACTAALLRSARSSLSVYVLTWSRS